MNIFEKRQNLLPVGNSDDVIGSSWDSCFENGASFLSKARTVIHPEFEHPCLISKCPNSPGMGSRALKKGRSERSAPSDTEIAWFDQRVYAVSFTPFSELMFTKEKLQTMVLSPWTIKMANKRSFLSSQIAILTVRIRGE
ncbi:hypothetical protein NPIL_235971 [Nephila pilipes]|uniref:Uncharacterized protein n=1 Tax=Nephila pilipes TaxID=299642 RepID=A0A8X6U305_NEPPI|nr:hypothetical protein NPIL_235971 [Nephila pilipes]